MLAWLKSVFPVNLSVVNFHEELCVLRDVYAVFLSGTVSKLCVAVTMKSVTGLPPLGGFWFSVKGMAQPDVSNIVHSPFFHG